MRVTLTCVEAGVYRVRGGLDRYDGRATVLATYCDWQIVWTPSGYAAETVRRFPTFHAAREWLDSDDGQAWLGGLPRLP